uniref:NADH-ubiquinone oxidoreductase chain 2 n=1 Tax=Pyrops viridirostris TaxID=2930515 RepID=A0A9E8G7J5_PYRVI|nr:NADH dehydrogenase subunit 2 [Pyrops viridirostris]UZT27064.1 NADH dehydrogenase subunit 2 [Pyrops viridirostris]
MKMNSSNIMFLTIMTMSVMMSMTSNNFLTTWTSMEINLISFVPLMKKSNKMNEQSMKYLIIQSVASSIMMASMIMNSIINHPINESIMMMTGVLMKVGMMPFHLWLPMTMQMVSWTVCKMMMTMQKIIPTIVASQMTSLKLMMTPMMLSMMVGPIVGMKQTSMKKMMAYSSITNSPIMIICLKSSKSQFMLFFLFYSMINILMINLMKSKNINFMNQLNKQTNMTKMSMLVSAMSMSGMPPTTGFLIKWMVMKSSMEMSTIIPMMMIGSSLISTFMYLNMIIPSLTKSQKNKMETSDEKSESTMVMIINLLGIPMATMTNLN